MKKYISVLIQLHFTYPEVEIRKGFMREYAHNVPQNSLFSNQFLFHFYFKKWLVFELFISTPETRFSERGRQATFVH